MRSLLGDKKKQMNQLDNIDDVYSSIDTNIDNIAEELSIHHQYTKTSSKSSNCGKSVYENDIKAEVYQKEASSVTGSGSYYDTVTLPDADLSVGKVDELTGNDSSIDDATSDFLKSIVLSIFICFALALIWRAIS